MSGPAVDPQYVNSLRHEVERLRLQVAGEPIPCEIESTPALDVDQMLRVEALRAAAARLVHGSPTPQIAIPATLDVARAFEAYLRDGDPR